MRLASVFPCTHHVFLSFRGETRKSFTESLYAALTNAGFCSFKDDEEIDKGENIRVALENAIKKSRISVIVFSKHYAGSGWCLHELLKIIEHKKTDPEHKVLPIFFDVEPSDVKHQTGSFKEAFDRHEERWKVSAETIEAWREALEVAADLEGLHLQVQANGNQAEFVEEILKKLRQELGSKICCVDCPNIDVASQAEHINKWLEANNLDVRGAMILGTEGIENTILARFVYDLNIGKFECGSFIDNINKASEEDKGLIRKQQQLLYHLTGQKQKIHSIDEGMSCIEDAAKGKKLLLVLDDVNNSHQLDAIVTKRESLSTESRVIITTRSKNLLKAHHGVYDLFDFQNASTSASSDVVEEHEEGNMDMETEIEIQHTENMVAREGPSTVNAEEENEEDRFTNAEKLKRAEIAEDKKKVSGEALPPPKTQKRSVQDMHQVAENLEPGTVDTDEPWSSPSSFDPYPSAGIRWACFPRSLKRLFLPNLNLSENAIPHDLGGLTSLEWLDLRNNPMKSLPGSIGKLSNLQGLLLHGCLELRTLPSCKTRVFVARGCTALETIGWLPNGAGKDLSVMNLSGCSQLIEIIGVFCLLPLAIIERETIDIMELIDMESIQWANLKLYNRMTGATTLRPLQGLYETGVFSLFLPGSEVPQSFTEMSLDAFNSIIVPSGHEIVGLNLCIIYSALNGYGDSREHWHRIMVRNTTTSREWDHRPVFTGVPDANEDMIWLSHLNFKLDELQSQHQLQICPTMGKGYTVKKCGLHFVCKKRQIDIPQSIRIWMTVTIPEYEYNPPPRYVTIQYANEDKENELDITWLSAADAERANRRRL